MKFDIALTFVAAAYAMELRQFPETIEEMKEFSFHRLPVHAITCVLARSLLTRFQAVRSRDNVLLIQQVQVD